jgi:hypothetical protein
MFSPFKTSKISKKINGLHLIHKLPNTQSCLTFTLSLNQALQLHLLSWSIQSLYLHNFFVDLSRQLQGISYNLLEAKNYEEGIIHPLAISHYNYHRKNSDKT